MRGSFLLLSLLVATGCASTRPAAPPFVWPSAVARLPEQSQGSFGELGPAPPLAPGTGGVRGIVRDAITQERLAGVTVVVSWADGARSTVTGVDGSYALGDLPAGTYDVEFRLGERGARTPIIPVLHDRFSRVTVALWKVEGPIDLIQKPKP
jgi:hypothetical protein